MDQKIRVFELAKELQVDSSHVMEVLQSLNVEVKNHMSTLDQETAAKVAEAVKRSPAKKSVAKPRPVEVSKPSREANPAKASLLEDFFGAGTKPRQSMEDMKREMRGQVERRPAAERSRVGAEYPARPSTERRLSERAREVKPTAKERQADAKAKPTQTPRVEKQTMPPETVQPHREDAGPTPEDAAPQPEAAKPQPEPTPYVASPVDAPASVPDPTLEPEPASVETDSSAPSHRIVASVGTPQAQSEEHVEQAPIQPQAPASIAPSEPGPNRPLPSGPAAHRFAAPTVSQRVAGPRPAGPSSSGMGLPSKMPPITPATDRASIEPMVRRQAGAAEGAPTATSGLGLPTRFAPSAAPERGPRPQGDRGLRPVGPSAGADRGGRPAGTRPGGFPPSRPPPAPFSPPVRGRTATLNIPKPDPKVTESVRPADSKPRIGQGGDRKKGDAFTKRETAASRPPEEKLFGRRPTSSRPSVVERRSLKPTTITGAMTVKDLAHEMGVTASEVIKKLLTVFGIIATINQELDTDTCVLVGHEFNVDVTVKEATNIIEEYDRVDDESEPAELKEPRHPVVTIMGHVDHGKTSLLDAIRSAKVAAGEAGGITQHIGAYEVELNGRKITFLDTPGHEAFTAMRARGANVTDIAVLVVAADDSVMPQTIESINHAKAAGVPILVAINKIDKPAAASERVKQDLTAHGLVAEEWGGDTIMVPVSAKQKINLDLLLENILVLAEVQDLSANPDKEARGTILEAELDKARGPVATVLVQAGTLHTGDTFVAGTAWGKVRAMFDHRGRKLKSAGPSTPVRILGFNSVPAAGDVFRVTLDEKSARDVADKRLAKVQAERQGTKAMSLDDFMSKVKEGEVKDLNLIVKGDVQGSVEALRGQLEKLRNEEVQVKIVHAAVGAVTETDVMLASASKAIVIGFNVRPDERATRAAAEQGIDIRNYDVIYNVVDDIKAAMTGMLAPKIEEVIHGRAEVREIFKVPKIGMAAGCMVLSGKITRTAKYRLIRDSVVVWTGDINALRRFKDEAREVTEGYECGVTLEKFQDFKPGDILEAFELKEVKAV